MKSLNTYTMLSILFYIFLFTATKTRAQTISHEALPGSGDDFISLLDGEIPSLNIEEVDHFNPGLTNQVPWSDSYWPTYKGLIASRYQMGSHPNSGSWTDYHNHYLRNPAEQLLSSGNISQLSPAEKYDLLIGDRNWTLTKYMWQRGQESMRKHGVVASWTGICHGWAAASQIGIPRAERSVTVTDLSGRYTIPFSVFDIMALTSFYWSKSTERTFFVGNRCKTPNPPRNENGRITDESCFDNNPMTWHLGVTNRVGKYQKTVVMDTSYSTEVWNYVVDNYHFIYFNPQTLEFSSQLQDAIVLKEDFRHDRFQATRSPDTKFIVGVIMDVFHPGAITPYQGVPSLQRMDWKRFMYDLELDSNKNVIGGEWHSKDRPDFMWGYSEQSNPFLTQDPSQFATHVNAAVASAALSSSKRGRVYGPLVNMLIAHSISESETIPNAENTREVTSTEP